MQTQGKCQINELNLNQAINKLSVIMWRISAKILQEDLHVSFAQFKMLMAIWHRGEISQKTIANFHGLSEAAVSRQIEQLVNEKLIIRRINESNRREHLLSLSAKGKTCVNRATKILDTHFNRLFNVLGRQKRKFTELLNTLLEHICAEEPEAFKHQSEIIKS